MISKHSITFLQGVTANQPGYQYLATAYTRHPGGPEGAYRMACRAAAQLLAAGVPVFSPIAHSHSLVPFLDGKLQFDHDFWMETDKPMLDAASGLIILRSPGWDESRGIAHEINVTRGQMKPVTWVDWDEA